MNARQEKNDRKIANGKKTIINKSLYVLLKNCYTKYGMLKWAHMNFTAETPSIKNKIKQKNSNVIHTPVEFLHRPFGLVHRTIRTLVSAYSITLFGG